MSARGRTGVTAPPPRRSRHYRRALRIAGARAIGSPAVRTARNAGAASNSGARPVDRRPIGRQLSIAGVGCHADLRRLAREVLARGRRTLAVVSMLGGEVAGTVLYGVRLPVAVTARRISSSPAARARRRCMHWKSLRPTPHEAPQAHVAGVIAMAVPVDFVDQHRPGWRYMGRRRS